MSCIKQIEAVRVSTTNINNTAIGTNFTSDAILIDEVCAFVLNVWFASAVTGTPLVTIEGSNTTDSASFKALSCAENIPLPEIITKSTYLPRYIRFVYDANGATGGNKNFDLTLICQ